MCLVDSTCGVRPRLTDQGQTRSFALNLGPVIWLCAVMAGSLALPAGAAAEETDAAATGVTGAGEVRVPPYRSSPSPTLAPVTLAPAAVAPAPASSKSIGPGVTLSPLPSPQYERDEDAPVAGYTNYLPFIRSRDSNFVLFPSGRLNVDGFFFLNRGDPPPGATADGSNDDRPRQTIFLRRARAELMGTVMKHFDYMIAGEFATTPVGAQSANAADVFVNINYTTWANIQVGQFDAPFTLENRTVDRFLDFMERSITVRSFGIPQNKDAGVMVAGMAPSHFLRYEVGVFNGDGLNVRNLDSHFDFMGRAYFAPLALLSRAQTTRWLSEIWIGGSIWYGKRVDVSYQIPALTTQGGVTLLPSSFGPGLQLMPNGELLKWAVELNVPIGPIGWRFELVHTDRENLGVYRPGTAMDTPGASRVLAASLNRNGTAFYAQMWYWILGTPAILPTPGQIIPLRWAGYRKGKEPWPIGLYISARYERLILHQDDLRTPSALTDDAQSAVGSMSVDSFGVALNAWFTRHMRFSVNYLLNYLDGDLRLDQNNGRLPMPGPTGQPTATFYRTAEHELLFRAAIGL